VPYKFRVYVRFVGIGVWKLTSPPMALPRNITAVFPLEATCITDPISNTVPMMIRLILRPSLSPTGAAIRQPKKQPAWSRETMLAEEASSVD